MALNKKVSEGTILLRQAEPKYKYVGRKLPKEPVEHEDINASSSLITKGKALKDSSPSTPSQPSSKTALSKTVQPTKVGQKPVAVVEASFPSPTVASPQSSVQLDSSNTAFTSPSQQSAFYSPSAQPDLSVSIPFSPNDFNGKKTLPTSSSSIEVADHTETQLIESSAAAAALSSVTSSMLAQRLQEVERERDQLKKDLESQLQVNAELKRLLVASVGDDLSKRVERLAQDRVQLSMDIGGFSKKMTEDYENLDKVSIQADMWRSKYLASRVMVEELGNARAYFSLQWHESQEALQQILNERHELRTNLMESYKILQQVKDAFDPLNSHRSSSLPSTNVLDLSRACQQLGEAVRFRLLPAHVVSSSSLEVDLDSWENSVTRAEQYAHELLSRPSEPAGSLQSGSSSVLPVTGSGKSPVINRFHPQVRHENVTIHCCKCKGDISVV